MGLLDRVDFKRSAATPPEAIDLVEGGKLRITWPGGVAVELPFKDLRDRCPCAECVEEWTGKKMLDRASIPDDIHPLALEAVGTYAVKIAWSDGHASGLFTWDGLRRACGLPEE